MFNYSDKKVYIENLSKQPEKNGSDKIITLTRISQSMMLLNRVKLMREISKQVNISGSIELEEDKK